MKSKGVVVVGGKTRTTVRVAWDLADEELTAMMLEYKQIPLEVLPCVPGREGKYYVAPAHLIQDPLALAAWAHRLSTTIFKGVLFIDAIGTRTWIEET